MTRPFQRLKLLCRSAIILLPQLAAFRLAAGPSRPGHSLSHKTIKLVIPFTPGGPTDLVARLTQQMLQEGLGQTPIIEYRPGAGGAHGGEIGRQVGSGRLHAADGLGRYAGCGAGREQDRWLRPDQEFRPYLAADHQLDTDARADGTAGEDGGELVAYAKANPGKVNFASAGHGNQTHLNVELFKSKTGIDIAHVPFKSGGEMVTAAARQPGPALVLRHFHDAAPRPEKKVRALAVGSTQRSPLLPDVPTVIEFGVPGFVTSFWTGLLAPAGTPPDVVNRLNAAIFKGLNSRQCQGALTKVGSAPAPSAPHRSLPLSSVPSQEMERPRPAGGHQVELRCGATGNRRRSGG